MFFNKKGYYLFYAAAILLSLSALYGFLIRWNFTFPLTSFPYQNALQSHSHVAFLGWGYLVSTGVIYQLFVSSKSVNKPWYNWCWGMMIICISMMLISFPLGGYKVFSIVLLATFGLVSYMLSFRLLKDINGPELPQKFIRFGIYYYLLSSLATWFLAGVIITVGKTDLYYNTVYFYLHFLYNGFFVFAIFGILFKLFQRLNISVNSKGLNLFFLFLNLACIPTYALSILWSDVSVVYTILGFIGSTFQVIALFYLLGILKSVFKQLKWGFHTRLLLLVGCSSFFFKIVLQFLSAFPFFVQKSIALKPYFIIGYLHLFTLGFMTTLLFLILERMNFISFKNHSVLIGVYLFLIGMIFTELLFFVQGGLYMTLYLAIPGYNVLLFLGSALMVMGILTMFFLKKRRGIDN